MLENVRLLFSEPIPHYFPSVEIKAEHLFKQNLSNANYTWSGWLQIYHECFSLVSSEELK